MKASMGKEKTARSKKTLIVDIILLVVSICLFVASCFVFVTRVYLTTFHVNGQSMWPTFNEYALDADGNEVGQRGGKSYVGYTVECGLYNKHKGALKRLERFDIVVTHYSTFGDSEMIKRIVGLPGEKIQFISSGENNGDLYVNGKYVEQPIRTDVLRQASYPVEPIQLGNDEYYVCGDNRSNSTDSRSKSVGPVTRSMLVGKVVAIIGTGVIKEDENGERFVKYSKIQKYRKVRFF